MFILWDDMENFYFFFRYNVPPLGHIMKHLVNHPCVDYSMLWDNMRCLDGKYRHVAYQSYFKALQKTSVVPFNLHPSHIQVQILSKKIQSAMHLKGILSYGMSFFSISSVFGLRNHYKNFVEEVFPIPKISPWWVKRCETSLSKVQILRFLQT